MHSRALSTKLDIERLTMTDGMPPSDASSRASFQEFNAVNIGCGFSLITGAEGINAKRDAGNHGHVIFFKIGLKRGDQVELRDHRFMRVGVSDRHKPSALVKISPLVRGVTLLLLPQ